MLIPQRLPNGSRAWLDQEVRSFTEALTAYDDRLALVQNMNGSWSIYRIGEDGSEHHIMRSKPGARLDNQVITMLQQHDTRRRNVVEDVIKQNEKVERDAQSRNEEQLFLALDKVLSKAWKGRIPSNIEDVSI